MKRQLALIVCLLAVASLSVFAGRARAARQPRDPPAERRRAEAGLSGPDPRARAEVRRGLRRDDRGRGAGSRGAWRSCPTGDAGDRAARPPAHRRAPTARCPSRSPACRRSTRAGRAGCSTSRSIRRSRRIGLIYWSYAEPRDERHEQHRRRARQARRRRGADASRTCRSSSTRRRRSTRRCTSAAGWCSAATARCSSRSGDRSITEGRMQAQQHGRPARQDRPHQRRRLDPEGQSVRRQGRRAAGDLVARPPQRPGRDAAPDDRRAVGSRARHARRRRDQHRAQGQGLRLADDRLRHRVPGRADHRRHPAAGRHGAAALLLGSGHRAERHGVLHRRRCSRRGRTACSSAAWAARTWCG